MHFFPSRSPVPHSAGASVPRRSKAGSLVWALGLLLGVGLASPAMAASEEIQVYMDDLSEPGKFGVDIHNNYVFSGSTKPGYPGEQPPARVYRLTPEFYYGLTDTLELGLYVLGTRAAHSDPNVVGGKVRIKYIAPHDKEQGVFWGANLEVGRTDLRASPTPWNAQLKGIFGYRTGPWTLAMNPNFDWSVSRGGGPVTFDIDAKVAYAVNAKTQIGFETYNELGPLRQLDGLSKNSKTVYAVIDHDYGIFDLNFGIGKGITKEADKWTLKFIVGRHF